MFYPADSLRRGGKFYLCWVADSWPLRFATITHRQLWSQDIRKICNELKEVVINESGRPTNRYSLRLSSQLMRGLVRLYQKKVNVFLSDLCMINANVTKHANKKFNIHEVLDLPHRARPHPPPLELPRVTAQEEPENEPRIEEIIQNSGNIVTNIQDITLREAAIPEFQIPPNDGFGEENAEQALQFLGDRTVEMVMAPADAAAAQHSGLGVPPFDITDKSHDKSRLFPQDLQMERLSEHDLTLFRRSDGASLLPVGDFEKEIPEIPDVPIPEQPVPQEMPQEHAVEIQDKPIEEPSEARDTARQSQTIQLEELEDIEPRAKRRRNRGLIIDKKIKISSNVFRARLDNPKVEIRCEDYSDDIIDIHVAFDVYMRRPCHAGYKQQSNIGRTITRLFMRNLGVVNKPTRIERESEIEAVMQRSHRYDTRSMLERIADTEQPAMMQDIPPQTTEQVLQTSIGPNRDDLPIQVDLLKDMANVTEGQAEQDISEMLTQKLDTYSQQARKRSSKQEAVPSPKKQRSAGYVSFRESQQKRLEIETTTPVTREAEKDLEISILDITDKENVPANKQTLEIGARRVVEKNVTAMLEQVGLADISAEQAVTEQPTAATRKVSRKQGSESSETPLGSLDRTKVSLGDSDETTDSRRFIRQIWGVTGTMIKILKCIKERKEAITVRSLIEEGPVISGHKAMIAASCFTSILKLKQHGFIKIQKCPETSEIVDITLGAKFY